MYYVVFGLSHLLSLLPFCILYFLSDALYLLMYYCIKYRRDVVRDNLLKSYPEKSLDELIRIETLKLTSISKKEMRKRMVFRGVEQVEQAVHEEGHNFIFLYLGHYCNWEWIA